MSRCLTCQHICVRRYPGQYAPNQGLWSTICKWVLLFMVPNLGLLFLEAHGKLWKVYIYIFIYLYVYLCICTDKCMYYVGIHTCICTCIHVHIHVTHVYSFMWKPCNEYIYLFHFPLCIYDFIIYLLFHYVFIIPLNLILCMYIEHLQLLDNFLRSNKSNINQSCGNLVMRICMYLLFH